MNISITEKQIIQENTKTIFLKPTKGLSNRIYNIDSMITFMWKYKFEKLKICWSDSEGFEDNCKFENLFDISNLNHKISFINEEDFYDQSKDIYHLHYYVKQNPASGKYSYTVNMLDIINKITSESFCYEWFARIDSIFPSIIKRDKKFISNLKPNPKIRSEIDNFCDENHISTINGIHIRRNDAISSPYGFNYELSSDQSFINLINHKIEENSVFLTTDCLEIQKKIIGKCESKNILHTNKSFEIIKNEKEKKNNTEDAVIDLFVLSRCKKIYGTNYSSFCLLASDISNKNYETVLINNYYHYSKNVLPNLSTVVAVKNRFSQLKIALHSWLTQESIKEIIIVDSSSSDVDYDFLASLGPKINYIKYLDKPNVFHRSKCLNIGINSAKYEHIFKMDVDYIISPYININQWLDINWDREFITGSANQRFMENEMGFLHFLHGFIATSKKNLLDAGGYDENFESYGWEDTDLYHRLINEGGLSRRIIPISKDFVPMHHMPHSDFHRTKNQEIKSRDESLLHNIKKSKYPYVL